MTAALYPNSEVQGFPHCQLRNMAAVLIHVRCSTGHHEVVEFVAVDGQISGNLDLKNVV